MAEINEPSRPRSRGASGADFPREAGPELPDPGETVELALRAKDGNREALSDLIARHEAWLRRVIRIKLGGPAGRARRFFDSVDVFQETMGVVMRKVGDLDVRTAGGVRQWLVAIASHQIKDCLKYADAERRNPDYEVRLQRPPSSAEASHRRIDPSAQGMRPDEHAWREELKQILDDAVTQLPEHYQEVVLLRDYAKEDWESVRKLTGKETVGATKQLYHRAWIKIRDLAAPYLKDDPLPDP